MPVTYYTEEEVQEYTRLLAECWGHIKEGSATPFARDHMLSKIGKTLGWKKPHIPGSFEPLEHSQE